MKQRDTFSSNMEGEELRIQDSVPQLHNQSSLRIY